MPTATSLYLLISFCLDQDSLRWLFSKCGFWTSSVDITWQLVRDPQIPHRPTMSETLEVAQEICLKRFEVILMNTDIREAVFNLNSPWSLFLSPSTSPLTGSSVPSLVQGETQAAELSSAHVTLICMSLGKAIQMATPDFKCNPTICPGGKEYVWTASTATIIAISFFVSSHSVNGVSG